ncbi:RNA polymerase sigma factor SigZ [Clostridium sp. D2Q-11]|uniref:RNA polymerase sigma factor SigZ n=1 Tax=Anaeromonas frigoriresistens TaxID=2683708 RepID=A0A942Z9R2_9FIRM|nr:RNA polymerase sigma factor SigZ [Anaeromonas frigoriresistens]
MNRCISCVWDDFSIPLKRYIKKRVSNEQDCDDILQEIFIKIHNNIESLENDNKIHGWIYKITRNTIIDFYRRNDKNHLSIKLPENLGNFKEEELSNNAEIASCLKVMVDNLPDIYKEAIILTEFQNMTQKELSEKTGISISGAKSRVQRARKMLKRMLLECCQLDMDRRGNIIDYKHKSSECKYC